MSNLIITDRDIDVVKYVYDMKFCTSTDAFEMFFASDGEKTKRYSMVRLKRLTDDGFIQTLKNNIYRSNFYFITEKGLNLIRNHFRDHMFPKKAPSKMDMRFFEHDRHVAICRTALEQKGLAKNWISERVITHDVITKGGEYRSKYMLQNLKKSQIPDALFTTRKGEICAFELEYTLKSTREMRQKLLLLSNESKYQNGLFSRVLIIAGSEKIKTRLEQINLELSAKFKIMDLEELASYE